MNRKAMKNFLLIHAGLIAGAALFPLYLFFVEKMPDAFSGCLLHDFFFVYCPLCGGTRAVKALLRFRFAEAFRYNALVTLAVPALLALDVWALVRIFRGKEHALPMPRWSWIVATVLLVGYGILRNVLMIVWGMDPVGDLGRFWEVLRKIR